MTRNWMWIVVAIGAVLVMKHFMIGRASKEDVQASLSEDAMIVDVRTGGEFAGGHYEGAVNIPLSLLPSRMDELGDKNRAIVLYCHSGARSGSAKRILEQAGFTNVLNAGSLRQMPR